MVKILLKINDEKELMYPVDGYVLGFNKFSYLFGKTFNLEEIKKIKKENIDKEIYVSLNCLVFNNELNEYKKLLYEIDKIGFDGIIVGDVVALTYNLKTNLILDQLHLNNSYYSINHYIDNGLKGVVLTNDITMDEINEIRNNTNAMLFKQVFGYPHLSTSKRMLITNYFNHFNINNSTMPKSCEIAEINKDDYYKIIEDSYGTHILGNKVLNLLGVKLEVDYEIIDGYMLNDIKDVVDAFINNDINKKDYFDKKYNADNGFINKKTIYKVKKDEE